MLVAAEEFDQSSIKESVETVAIVRQHSYQILSKTTGGLKIPAIVSEACYVSVKHAFVGTHFTEKHNSCPLQ